MVNTKRGISKKDAASPGGRAVITRTARVEASHPGYNRCMAHSNARAGATLLALALVTLVSACAGFGAYEAAYAEPEASGTPPFEAADSPAMVRSVAESDAVALRASRPDDTVRPGPSAERLRVYSGALELSVARVDAARQSVIDYVQEIGGHVERSGDDGLVVRVPAGRFAEAMQRIESEGILLSRSVETADVTEQYADLERRLEIAERSRDRLYVLLERSEEASERVAILREIRRLTEEVERLRSSLASLADLAAFSRISVRLVPRMQATGPIRDRIPFRWIARLDPLTTTLPAAAREIPLTVPDSFAVFETGRRIHAEGADGSRIRAGARSNEPVGSPAFWAQALAFHLEPFYQTVSSVAVGSFAGVELVSRGAVASHYLVLVTVREEELIVLEVFLPTPDARETLMPQIISMIEGGWL